LVDMKASLVHMNSPNTALVRTGISTCVASTIVDADIDTVAAWEMEKLSRDNMKVHRQEDGRERSLVEDDPKGTAIYRICRGAAVPGLLPREFVSTRTSYWPSPDTFVVVYESIHDPVNYPITPEYVRGFSTSLLEYQRLPPLSGVPQTRVVWTVQVRVAAGNGREARRAHTLGYTHV